MTSANINKIVNKKSKELLEKLEESGIKVQGIITEDDYSQIYNRCCENILGYKKIPLGVSNRPIKINNDEFWIPICTTEGALVASMCRGIKLINNCGGIRGIVENLGITRSFTIEFPDFEKAITFYKWLKKNSEEVKKIGDRTSRFLKIREITSKHLIGNEVIIKVFAYTGDAMGMNMITKACNAIANFFVENFEGSRINSISSNICTDKKWSIENYATGRGRRVSLNLEIDEKNCREILKVSIDDILRTYHSKIVIGSSLVLGGFNSQASNYIAGTFIALGQDVAHVVDSSNCIISMKKVGEKLSISLYMPSMIVGTIGGGTHLEPALSFIKQFYKPDSEYFITDRDLDCGVAPNYLAISVASAVFAGEISVLASIADNTLIDAHLKLNRK